MNQLDQSHRTLLENFSTFQKAEHCLKEIKEAIVANLKLLEQKLNAEHSLKFAQSWDDGSSKKEYPILQARAFQKGKGTDGSLISISIGIEGFTVGDLLGLPSERGCQAYVYSEAISNLSESLRAQLHSLPAPSSFVSASLEDCYLFTKSLGPVGADIICSPDAFQQYFYPVFKTLIDWYIANASQIETF